MGLFSNIFRPKNKTITQIKNINESQGFFTSWSGNAYENDIYRSAIDSIARNCGKLKGSHVINYSNHREAGDCKINRILQYKPNPFMNSYDFLYKMVTHLYLHNNSFALIERDRRGNLSAVYPITCNTVEFLSDDFNNLYCRFYLKDGKQFIFSYKDLIHLRRHFNASELLGDNNTAIDPALELAHTQNEGIINGIKAGANIRGMLKYTQLLSPEKLRQEKEKFINDYLQVNNDGGIVALDQKAEYIPLESKPTFLSAEQTEQIENKIYNYLGITKKIVNGSYNEDEFLAFYESIVEPIALALGLEFTNKIFTEREITYGNQIIFESGRLQYASPKTKVSLIKELVPLGILTKNQALEILNLPGVEDGDSTILSLNYINKDIAEEYQLNKAKGGDQ